MNYYSRKNGNNEECLQDHLSGAAQLCGKYCSMFTKKEYGEFLGWFHDAGKMTERFQNVLNGKESHVNHAIISGLIASQPGFDKFCKTDKSTMSLLTDILIAHHSEIITNSPGLKSCPHSWDDLIGDRKYAVSTDEEFRNICQEYVNLILSGKMPVINGVLSDENLDTNLKKMLFYRMLYSCLVDADYTSSALFGNKNYLKETEIPLNPDAGLKKLEDYRNNLIQGTNQAFGMNSIRSYVYQCGLNNVKEGGMFSLIAPTGSAKTLCMTNWALLQAKKFNKDRIFVVLPFLSIISPVVKLYEDIFGKDWVLEDDSMVENLTDKQRELTSRWTTPIVVPTMVKFLESLFNSSAAGVRHLHNLCNSIIIFDEFQAIPPYLLESTLNSLRELSKRYGCTILFSSATPPNFSARKGLEWWNNEVTEIIDDVPALFEKYNQIKKMNVCWDLVNKLSIEDAAKILSRHTNSCMVVNTRKAANKIYEQLLKHHPQEACFLISTNLCNKHRIDTVEEIKLRQKQNKQVFVVSTQCIEAGVDISFEYVYREIAPLEAIIQTAGRCARNAEFIGTYQIFVLQNELQPDVSYRNAKEQTRAIYRSFSGNLDMSDLDVLRDYYNRLYKVSGFDKDSATLLTGIKEFDFPIVKDSYKVIPNTDQIRIIVPYAGNISIYTSFKDICLNNNYLVKKSDIKKIQSITVNTFNMEYKQYCKPVYIQTKHHPEGLESNIYILLDGTVGVEYNSKIGLMLSDLQNYIF